MPTKFIPALHAMSTPSGSPSVVPRGTVLGDLPLLLSMLPDAHPPSTRRRAVMRLSSAPVYASKSWDFPDVPSAFVNGQSKWITSFTELKPK